MPRRFAAVCGFMLFMASSARAADPAGEPRPNKLSSAEVKAGWKLLFDGKSTKGWRGYKAKAVPSAWVVQDGALAFDKKEGATGGDLLTRDQYENFELSIDWRVGEGGNSGIMYHVQETEDHPWRTGPEMQVLDNARHRDGKNPLTSAGSCYGLYAPSKDVTRPVGEWNQARLVVNGPAVEHWLNGEKIVSYEKGSADWDAKVAGSKFKSMPNFGESTRGHIDLQDHGDRVEFRNIKLRVLRPVKTASN
jgi:cytochrome c